MPHALEMRRLKYGAVPDEERDVVADALRAAGRRAEAILLLERRPQHPALEGEIRWAIENGSAFHLLSIRRSGRDVPEEAFRALAAEAERRGRYMDARQAWLAVDAIDEVRRFAEHLPESLRPAPATTAPE